MRSWGGIHCGLWEPNPDRVQAVVVLAFAQEHRAIARTERASCHWANNFFSAVCALPATTKNFASKALRLRVGVTRWANMST